MMPKRPQKIEIEKEHPDLLLLGSQAVTTKCPNFLGTALSFGIVFMIVGTTALATQSVY
jgi:hypothetical protein